MPSGHLSPFLSLSLSLSLSLALSLSLPPSPSASLRLSLPQGLRLSLPQGPMNMAPHRPCPWGCPPTDREVSGRPAAREGSGRARGGRGAAPAPWRAARNIGDEHTHLHARAPPHPAVHCGRPASVNRPQARHPPPGGAMPPPAGGRGPAPNGTAPSPRPTRWGATAAAGLATANRPRANTARAASWSRGKGDGTGHRCWIILLLCRFRGS